MSSLLAKHAFKTVQRVSMQNRRALVSAHRAMSTASFPSIPADASTEQIVAAIDAHRATLKLAPEETFFGGLGSAIKEYGYYPTAGFLLAFLISKEYFHIGAEFVSVMDTVSVMFVGYVLGADKISEAIKEFRCDYVNHLKDTFTAKKDLLKAQMEICQSKINTPAVTADIHKAFVEANAAAAKANALKAHHAAREKTVSRLNQIYVAEQATLNARRDAVRTNARQYVLDNVAGAPIKASVLKEAISLVGATEDKTGTFAALDKLVADAVKHAKSKQ